MVVFVHHHICGCYYMHPPPNTWSPPVRKYLPQVDVKAHTTILSTASKTTLSQKFVVLSKHRGIKNLRYTFPLYDGVSVVGFKVRVSNRTITGEVKEKAQARAEFKEAVNRGEVAGLLEQLPDASDVFTTTISNVPPNSTIHVEITYLGELKHDAEVDGLRFTIPTMISPRYGHYPGQLANDEPAFATLKGKFEVTVDALLDEGHAIREIRSPSHPIAISMGTLSTDPDGTPSMNQSSATLSLGTAELEKDFVLQVVSKQLGTPKALIEEHSTIAGHRALMATLVPKFQLPAAKPEIVFVCDRSGSMDVGKIAALKSALKVFLKSMPVGVVFNICSFGSRYDYLWSKSQSYNQDNMDKALKYVDKISANYGGTEMLAPIKDTIKRRFKDRNLEVFLVTDGQIWDQQSLFDHLNEVIKEKKEPVRVFTLGIGDGVSHSLIEGVARCGNGFCQSVGENEKMDSKVVRMLKGALFPHITDYSLEVKYGPEDGSDDDFEVVEKVSDSLKVDIETEKGKKAKSSPIHKIISLFDQDADLDADIKDVDQFKHLPTVLAPKILQAPHEIPSLFPFNRFTVYLLLPPGTRGKPTSVMLRGTSEQGPVQLEIPVQYLTQPGNTIHQLAAKKAIQELETGHGWIQAAKIDSKPIKDKYPSYMEELARREVVQLGVQFQLASKYTSFVAVEKKDEKKEETPEDFEFLDDEIDKLTLVESADYGAANVQLSGSVRSASGSHGFMKKSAQAFGSRGRVPAPSKGAGVSFGVLSGAPRMLKSVAKPRSVQPGMFRMRTPSPPTGRAMMSAAPRSPRLARRSPDKEFAASVDMLLDDEEEQEDDDEDDNDEDLGMSRNRERIGLPPPPLTKSSGSLSTPIDALHALIALQTFEGAWDWKKELWTLLKVDPKIVDKKAPGMDKRSLATALAIRFLETKLKSMQDTWELIVEKANAYLDDNPGPGKDVLLKTASEILA